MDRQDLDIPVELELDGADLPPDPPEEPAEAPRPSTTPPSGGVASSHLFTFVVVLFAALELQAILVLMGTADNGMAEAMTWAFGGVFVLSVFVWFTGGMLWFNSQFDR